MKLHRLTAFVLVLVMVFALLPAAVPAQAVEETDLAITYTREMTDNIFRYLDEVYIGKYPQLGLRWTHGKESDKQTITKLAQIITQGCTTDREKADAILGWIQRNIRYDVDYGGVVYSIDVFYARAATCAGYAMLMQDLLRMSGIPAVFGDGVRGNSSMNMETMTVAQVQEKGIWDGHAWCYAYVDGQWLLYDPLWSNEGTNDREYLSVNYFQATVDNITPIYGDDIPFREPDGNYVVYRDGRFIQVRKDGGSGYLGGSSVSINNTADYHYWFCTCKEGSTVSCGMHYMFDHDERHDQMIEGEAFSGGWLCYGGDSTTLASYAFENAVLAEGLIMERDGVQYLLHAHESWYIYTDLDNFRIHMGVPTVEPGFSGRLILPTDYFKYENGQRGEVEWISSNPDQIAVDNTGAITALTEGSAYISLRMVGEEHSFMGFTVWCLQGLWVDDFSDNKNASGGPVLGGEEVECTEHQFTEWEIIEEASKEPGKEHEGLKIRYCTRCGLYEEDVVMSFDEMFGTGDDGQEDDPRETTGGETPRPTENTSCKEHQFTDWEIIEEPSEESDGLKVRYCTRCGYGEATAVTSGNGGSSQDPTVGDTQGTTGVPVTTMPPVDKIEDTVDQPEMDQILSDINEKNVLELFAESGSNALSFDAFLLEVAAGSGMPMEITIGDAVIALDHGAVSNLFAQLPSGLVTVELIPIQTAHLTAQQQTALTGRGVERIYAIGVRSGDSYIHELGGTATVTFPFAVKDGDTAGDYKVFYVSEGGSLEEMSTTVADGSVSFTTDHFSAYALLNTAVKPEVHAEKPAGSAWPAFAVGGAVLAVAAVVVVLILIKKRKTA